ncbi:MAG: OmpA family protein [Acidiphilium sp.]|nr:OmpA family protein [Acidiphilium sp.]
MALGLTSCAGPQVAAPATADGSYYVNASPNASPIVQSDVAAIVPVYRRQGVLGTVYFGPHSQQVRIAGAIQPSINPPPGYPSAAATTSLGGQGGAAWPALRPSIGLATLRADLRNHRAGGLPLEVHFAFGSAIVPVVDRPAVAIAARWIATYSNVQILVLGMASPPGGFAYNQSLAERRAEAIAALLIENGVPAARISTRSFGIINPARSGQSAGNTHDDQRSVVLPGLVVSGRAASRSVQEVPMRYFGCPSGPVTQSLCDLR